MFEIKVGSSWKTVEAWAAVVNLCTNTLRWNHRALYKTRSRLELIIDVPIKMLLLCELVCVCAGVTLFQAKAPKYIFYLHITTSIYCFMQKRLNTLFHPAFSMHFNAAAAPNLHLTPEFSAFVGLFSISPFFRQHFLHITGHSVPLGISVFFRLFWPPFCIFPGQQWLEL